MSSEVFNDMRTSVNDFVLLTLLVNSLSIRQGKKDNYPFPQNFFRKILNNTDNDEWEQIWFEGMKCDQAKPHKYKGSYHKGRLLHKPLQWR